MDKIHQKTDYPKIFSKTYWGNFRADENPHLLLRVDERNEFVERFKIAKHYETPRSVTEVFRSPYCGAGDHPEAYLTETNQIVLLFSEHPANKTFEQYPFYEYIGYAPSDLQLYTEDQTTYIAVFPCLAALKQYAFAFMLEDRVGRLLRGDGDYDWRTPLPGTRQLWSPTTSEYYPYLLGPGYTPSETSETLLLPKECFISHWCVRIPKKQRFFLPTNK